MLTFNDSTYNPFGIAKTTLTFVDYKHTIPSGFLN